MTQVSIVGWTFIAAIGIYLGSTAQDNDGRLVGFAMAACAADVAVLETIAFLRTRRKTRSLGPEEPTSEY